MIQTENIEPIRVQTDDGWVVVVQHTPWADAYEMWIGKVEGSKFYTCNVGKDGYLKMKETNEGSQTPPTMRINGRAWGGLIRALRGVTPQVDIKEVDAELKATKYHLEDLRTLVFKKSKSQ